MTDTHFIEVYSIKKSGNVNYTFVLPIQYLDVTLEQTSKEDLMHTVAVFRIKCYNNDDYKRSYNAKWR